MIRRVATSLTLVLALLLPPASAIGSSEDGGSGLIRVDHAYSLPIGRPLLSLYGGFFSDDVGPDSARYLTMVPSLTWGLGSGVEVAGSLQFDALTEKLDEADFGRRLDIRRRDAAAKIRWTGPLGTTRFRVGAQGLLGIPIAGSDRAGATRDADNQFDPGIMGLVSTNIGWFQFPVRIHGNVGYWWSRNDGAYYFRQLPSPISLPSPSDASNDVFSMAIGAEAGLQRALVIAELATEQLVGARSHLRSSENLWRLTLGARTMVTATVGLTAALSFDLSSDDSRTEFDPSDAYPDVEFRVGMSIGSVLSRQNYEASNRESEVRSPATAPESNEPLVAPRLVIREASQPPQVAAKQRDPIAETNSRLREIEARINELEITTRLGLIEARLGLLERGWNPAPSPSPSQPQPPATLSADPPAEGPSTPQATRQSTPPAATPRASTPNTTRPTDAADSVASPSQTPQSTPLTSAPSETERVMSEQLAALQNEISALQREAVLQSQREAQNSGHAEVERPGSRLTIIEGDRTLPAAETAVLVSPSKSSPRETESRTRPDRERSDPRTSSTTANQNAPGESEAFAAPTTPPPAVEATPSPETESVERFPLSLGGRELLVGFDLDAVNLAQSAANRAVLDPLGELLGLHPQVRIAVLVHAADNDGAAALQRSERQAESIREYLVAAGADPSQVVALGMGMAEALGAPTTGQNRVELERLR